MIRHTTPFLPDPFGPVISTYTRAQAIADGTLVDVTEATDASGRKLSPFKYPVAMTRAAYAATIEVGGKYELPPDETPDTTDDTEVLVLPNGQDVAGRLWDVFWMLLAKIRAGGSTSEIRFTVLVSPDGRRRAQPVHLKSICGPGDNAEPVLTILLPDED